MFQRLKPSRLASIVVSGLSVTALGLGSATTFANSNVTDVVVITGDRAPQDRSETSLAISVIGQDEIEQIGAHHISEALNRLPGVNLHRGNGAEHLTAIRSPVLTGGAGAGSFLYLEDGVPLRSAGFANVNGLFEAVDDLAGRIEVVRGPGSAVYGSNALHGLVNVISADPEVIGQRISFETGSFGRSRLMAQTGGQTRLGAASVGMSIRREDGWRDDASLDRAALQARLDGQAGSTQWSLRFAGVNLNQETASFVRGFEVYRDEAASRANPDPEAFRDAHALRASLHVEHPLDDGFAFRGVVYARSNEMDFLMHFLPSEALEQTGHDSFGFQSALVWASERSELQIGADAEFTTGDLREFQSRPTIFSFVQGLHYDYTVKSRTFAGFAQGRRQLSERVRLEGGARIEHTHYDYENNAPDGVVGRFLRLPDRTDDFTTFAPHAGLIFDVSDTVSLFARVARGVRAPQTAELYRLQPGQDIESIDPETLDAVELGVRTRLSDAASLSLTGFAMQKENVFFRDADGINVTDGETRHRGVEVEGTWSVTETLTLSGSASWAIHEYAFDRLVGNASEVIRDGARIDSAPEWLANLRVNWMPHEAIDLEAEWVNVGEYFANAANTAEYEGHQLVHFRATTSLSDRLDGFFSIRNALDERYAERADFAFGSYRYFPGEPRAFYLGVRFSNAP